MYSFTHTCKVYISKMQQTNPHKYREVTQTNADHLSSRFLFSKSSQQDS